MKENEETKQLKTLTEALETPAGLFAGLERLERNSDLIKYLTCSINEIAQANIKITEAVAVKLTEMAEEENEEIDR